MATQFDQFTTQNPLGQQLIDYAKNLYGQYYGGLQSAKGQGGSSFSDANSVVDNLYQNQPQVLKQILPLVEQGKFTQADLPLLQNALGTDPTAKQALNERISGLSQLDKQNQELQQFKNQVEQQSFGGQGLSLSQALTTTGGDIGNLNQFLMGQEAQTFNTQLKPLIQMALGAQGLSDSGAQVELQSKALSQLEQQRQQTMMQAALGARGTIQGLQQSQVLGDIGSSQQMLNNQFDLQRAGLTMQFQQQLEDQRMQLARELAARQGGGNSTLQQVLGGIGMAGSIAAAPFTGGSSLAALPGFTGMALGGPGSAVQGAGGASMLGSSFFANNRASTMPVSQSYQYGPMTGTMNNGRAGGWQSYP